MGEDEVIERVTRLRGERIIRQVSAIFDTRKLGYRSMLVAARAPRRAGRRGRRGDLDPPRRDPQLRAQARVQHLVHAGRPADVAAGPRPDGRAARRDGRRRGDPAAAGAALLQDRRRPRHGRRPRPGRQARARRAGARGARARRARASATSPRCARSSPTCGRCRSRSRGRQSGTGSPFPSSSRRPPSSRRPARCAASPPCSTTARRASRPTGWASGRCPTSGSTRWAS